MYINTDKWVDQEIKKSLDEYLRLLKFDKQSKKDFYKQIRVYLTGKEQGVDLFKIMEVLGKRETVSRLNDGVLKAFNF